VAAGVRRIEAVTGRHAYELHKSGWQCSNRRRRFWVARRRGGPQSIGPDGTNSGVGEIVEKLRRQQARQDFERLLGRTQEVKGVRVLSAQVEAADVAMLREMSDWFRERMGRA